ncbi:hypothetical protein B0T09DRAFT_381686 [Sordaria sp. MPI-SDFR-AT-0083]|nr:hypothetical protein B0T09DRAFT_381686 [Sordaria sp. MPI-SDFR-AT-0083]
MSMAPFNHASATPRSLDVRDDPTTILASLFIAIAAAAPAIAAEKRTDVIAPEARDISAKAAEEDVKKREADPYCQILKTCY